MNSRPLRSRSNARDLETAQALPRIYIVNPSKISRQLIAA